MGFVGHRIRLLRGLGCLGVGIREFGGGFFASFVYMLGVWRNFFIDILKGWHDLEEKRPIFKIKLTCLCSQECELDIRGGRVWACAQCALDRTRETQEIRWVAGILKVNSAVQKQAPFLLSS